LVSIVFPNATDSVPFVQHGSENRSLRLCRDRFFIACGFPFGNVVIATEGGTPGRPVRGSTDRT
jgi:hypothetical protein